MWLLHVGATGPHPSINKYKEAQYHYDYFHQGLHLLGEGD